MLSTTFRFQQLISLGAVPQVEWNSVRAVDSCKTYLPRAHGSMVRMEAHVLFVLTLSALASDISSTVLNNNSTNLNRSIYQLRVIKILIPKSITK